MPSCGLGYHNGDSYQQTSERGSSSTGVAHVAVPQAGSTSRTYNVNGELVQTSDTRDASKNRYFANNAQGEALTVVQGNYDGQGGRLSAAQAFQNAIARTGNQVQAQYFFFANGQQVGSFGQLQSSDGSFKANFDINYTPISDNYPPSVPSQYIVQSGDTLKTVAAKVFGDASLWYLIADDNGLTDPDATLEEGTQLRIPNDVVSLKNTATSFKPFSVQDAIGDTTPTQPAPPPVKHGGGGCGIIGQIIVVIVAVVVTVLSWGTLGPVMAAMVGSVVSQGVGIAIGVQDKFNWGAVAAAGLTAGILSYTPVGSLMEGATSNPFVNEALQGAVNNVTSQGVNIALGLQDKFSWKEVAISAVSAPAANYVADKVGTSINPNFKAGVVNENGFKANVVSGLASGVTSVAVRAALGGRVDFVSVIGDAFGNAIGNSIVDNMQVGSAAKDQKKLDTALDEMGVVKDDAKAVAAALSDPTKRAELQSKGYNPDKMRSTYVADLASGDVYLDYNNPTNDPVQAAKIDGMKEALGYFGVDRLSDTQLTDLHLDPSAFKNDKSGYYAALYKDETTGGYLLANRGTESLRDLVTDIANNFGSVDGQFKEATQLATVLSRNEAVGANLTFTGHSLGGGLASAQAAKVGGNAITFNAAGLTQRVADKLQLNLSAENKANIEANYLKGDLVSGLQDSHMVDIAGAVLGTPVKYAIDAAGLLSGQIKPSDLNLTIGYAPEAFGTRRPIEPSSRINSNPITRALTYHYNDSVLKSLTDLIMAPAAP